MKKQSLLEKIAPFKWYILFSTVVIGGKVYADYNNIDIIPSGNETKVDHARRSGSRGHFFYGGGSRNHK
ncbi:hypothetical protein [Polluticaenibacter yanchengensis]|uniref:Uncharacterized protein n=1 Tax=Polluticaenibacter yanchengensis TaxID=3014562 RepID=A0ABT4UG87_9BACT|nr:hypothetical protein [Chitinophagaceae bacterium LY-5]